MFRNTKQLPSKIIKEEIMPFLTECLDKIPKNYIFINNTKIRLKCALITNRANIRGEALRRVISIV